MSDKADGQIIPPPKIRWMRAIATTAVGLLLLGLLPSCSRPAKRGAMTLQLSNLKQVSLALHMYSLDHEGPPKALAEVAITEKYCNKEGWAAIGQYTAPKTKQRIDWLYYPKRIPANPEAKVLILASPEAYKGDRVVAWSDTSCAIIPEEEFVKLNAAAGAK